MRSKRNLIRMCLLGAVLLQATTSGAQPVTQVAAGRYHSLFLKGDGSLWAMGLNQYAQLGDGSSGYGVQTNLPEQIVASGVTAAAAGGYHSLFLKSDGSLWGTGWSPYGELGDGTAGANSGTNRPEQIVASGVTAVATGDLHSLFLKADGSLWAMGWNDWGQLGDGSYNSTNLPEQIVASGVTAIAAGWYHSLFLKSDGSLWSMGWNQDGQLGDGTVGVNSGTNRPEQIVATGVTAVSAGGYHSLFLKSDGSLWGMGSSHAGQLGDGTFNNVYRPEQIVASNVMAIAAGAWHSLFLKSDGSLWAMGGNEVGQLGDATYNSSYLPERIVASGVTAVAAGYLHNLFVKSDGSLWAMGDNEVGQLGDGTYTTSFPYGTNLPEQIVAGPPGFNQIDPQLLDGGALRLSFLGFAGTNYALDCTYNLSPANWVPLATNPAESLGVLVFTNTPNPATNNFWRIRSVP